MNVTEKADKPEEQVDLSRRDTIVLPTAPRDVIGSHLANASQEDGMDIMNILSELYLTLSKIYRGIYG